MQPSKDLGSSNDNKIAVYVLNMENKTQGFRVELQVSGGRGTRLGTRQGKDKDKTGTRQRQVRGKTKKRQGQDKGG